MTLTVTTTTSARVLALIGGGEFSFGETRDIDAALLGRMPADRRKVAFIPAASGSSEYATHLGSYLRGIDESVEVVNVPIYRTRDARRQKNLDLLLAAGMIYLGAGVTNHLVAALAGSPAEATMRQAASAGTVIAAIGAAASCFGTWVSNMRAGTPLEGLGWLSETVVETGFDPENDTPLRRLMSLPDVKLGLGVPPRSALVIGPDGSTEILGEGGPVAAFRKR